MEMFVSGGLFGDVCIKRCDAPRPLHLSQTGSATSDDDTTRLGASGERKAKRKQKGIKINLRAVCLVRAIFDDEVDGVVDESGCRKGRWMDG